MVRWSRAKPSLLCIIIPYKNGENKEERKKERNGDDHDDDDESETATKSESTGKYKIKKPRSQGKRTRCFR